MKFKIGDIVICRHLGLPQFTGSPGGDLSMEKWLGKPMTITRISDYVEVKENEWC